MQYNTTSMFNPDMVLSTSVSYMPFLQLPHSKRKAPLTQEFYFVLLETCTIHFKF